MERKTIGAFIAALRKAQGLTQRQLAEKLNVSDKTISRWERDEGAPDLAAIPVLAEIFNVSCDELLRGGRRAAEEGQAMSDAGCTAMGEKQRRRLLALSLVRFKNRSYVAMALSATGLVAAMILNSAFLRARLGFFTALIFFICGAVCQLIFRNSALLAVNGLDEDELMAEFKLAVLRQMEYSLGLCAVLAALCTPLLLPYLKSNMGLDADSWLEYGALAAAAALLLVFTACYIINGSFLQSCGGWPENASRVLMHNHRLKLRCALVLGAALLITALAHAFSTQLWGPRSIAESREFYDVQSFIEYMETEVPAPWETEMEAAGPVTYYDEDGREISREESLRRTITDPAGNVVCEYIERNQSVASVQCSFRGGELIKLDTVSYEQLEQAKAKARVRHTVFACVYPLELAAALLVYYKKRLKEDKMKIQL